MHSLGEIISNLNDIPDSLSNLQEIKRNNEFLKIDIEKYKSKVLEKIEAIKEEKIEKDQPSEMNEDQ